MNSIYVANLEINTDQLPIKFKMGTQGKTEQNSGIIGSIQCGCIECITAPVPPALIVPFNSDLEIYPFVTSHAV